MKNATQPSGAKITVNHHESGPRAAESGSAGTTPGSVGARPGLGRPSRWRSVSLASLTAALLVVPASFAANGQATPAPSESPDGIEAAAATRAGGPATKGSSRLRLRVTGELLGKTATITVQGVRGSARGFRKQIQVSRKKVLRRLPAGTYKVKAGLIQAPADPNTNPLFAPFPRTSAAQTPAQRVRVANGESERVQVHYPKPPKFPRNFKGRGRYIVRDLGFDVPFKWQARNGDIQMIAGGWDHPIYFTNVITGGQLYTKTYKWPNVGPGQCLPTGPWDRKFFNDWFQTARYVGPETLDGPTVRQVNHFRVGLVFSFNPEPGDIDRSPLAIADFFVDRADSRVIWNVQHFGIQNKLDPQLDEWIQMKTFKLKAGRVNPPSDCKPA